MRTPSREQYLANVELVCKRLEWSGQGVDWFESNGVSDLGAIAVARWQRSIGLIDERGVEMRGRCNETRECETSLGGNRRIVGKF